MCLSHSSIHLLELLNREAIVVSLGAELAARIPMGPLWIYYKFLRALQAPPSVPVLVDDKSESCAGGDQPDDDQHGHQGGRGELCGRARRSAASRWNRYRFVVCRRRRLGGGGVVCAARGPWLSRRAGRLGGGRGQDRWGALLGLVQGGTSGQHEAQQDKCDR